MTYESYTKQALPNKKYRELLGSAICVFNSNNSFVIENILKHDYNDEYSWHRLIDETSGILAKPIKETITKNSDAKIADLFREIVSMRNRIVHSFQITDKDKTQKLATKEKNGSQYVITEEYLFDFIKKNEELSTLLHNFRGY